MVPRLGEPLEMLCGIIKVAPACAVVVRCVESGGAGSPRQAPVYGARTEDFVRAFQSL